MLDRGLHERDCPHRGIFAAADGAAAAAIAVTADVADEEVPDAVDETQI